MTGLTFSGNFIDRAIMEFSTVIMALLGIMDDKMSYNHPWRRKVRKSPEGEVRGVKGDSRSLLLKGDYLPESRGERACYNIMSSFQILIEGLITEIIIPPSLYYRIGFQNWNNGPVSKIPGEGCLLVKRVGNTNYRILFDLCKIGPAVHRVIGSLLRSFVDVIWIG